MISFYFADPEHLSSPIGVGKSCLTVRFVENKW
jgi:hypothetical protein